MKIFLFSISILGYYFSLSNYFRLKMDNQYIDLNKNKQLLLGNKGFKGLEDQWIYLVDKFKIENVPATEVQNCPYCNLSFESSKVIGQYLYYSNLIRLRECENCKLVYSDVVINKEIIETHFRNAYKDNEYFNFQRDDIFNQIAQIVIKYAPKGASILDIGGATGVLAKRIISLRPDLEITIADISEIALAQAEKLGFRTIKSSISEIPLDHRFDLILLIDVLYYENYLKKSIEHLNDLLVDDGILIYRGPNKNFLIRLMLLLKINSITNHKISFFNPEHIYLLTSKFLIRAFYEKGFSHFKLLPSKVIKSRGPKGLSVRSLNILSRIIFNIFGLIVSPSLILIAKKKSQDA